jgi:hypothetical protein
MKRTPCCESTGISEQRPGVQIGLVPTIPTRTEGIPYMILETRDQASKMFWCSLRNLCENSEGTNHGGVGCTPRLDRSQGTWQIRCRKSQADMRAKVVKTAFAGEDSRLTASRYFAEGWRAGRGSLIGDGVHHALYTNMHFQRICCRSRKVLFEALLSSSL